MRKHFYSSPRCLNTFLSSKPLSCTHLFSSVQAKDTLLSDNPPHCQELWSIIAKMGIIKISITVSYTCSKQLLTWVLSFSSSSSLWRFLICEKMNFTVLIQSSLFKGSLLLSFVTVSLKTFIFFALRRKNKYLNWIKRDHSMVQWDNAYSTITDILAFFAGWRPRKKINVDLTMVDTYCAWHVLLHTTHLHFKTINSIPFFISISPNESRRNQKRLICLP